MPLNPDTSELSSRKQEKTIFIETGTGDGHGIQCALDANFKEIYSVELSKELYEKAKERFKEYPNVHLICGSSEIELPKILEKVEKEFILWLDAHWSGGPYIGERMHLYLPKELNAIKKYSHKFENSIIMIDDMNHYINDYQFCKSIENLVNDIKKTGDIKYHKSLFATHLIKE